MPLNARFRCAILRKVPMLLMLGTVHRPPKTGMGSALSNAHKAFILLVSFAFAIVAPLALSTPATAAPVTYTLFAGRGSTAGTGWSFNNTTLSSPGPTLTATVGDTVTLILNRTDARFHSWYIDYNNNSAWNPGTPNNESGTDFPNATTFQAVTWSFVPTKNGTFYYRSSHGGDGALWGLITVAPAGAGQVIPGVDNTVLIVVGVVIIIIAVLAVATMYMRRSKKPRKEPPPPP